MRSLPDAVSGAGVGVDRVRDGGRTTAAGLRDHEACLRRLEAAGRPLPALAALAGVGGAMAVAVALFQH